MKVTKVKKKKVEFPYNVTKEDKSKYFGRHFDLSASSFRSVSACKECGDKLTFSDEKKYGICRGCGSEFIIRRYL